MRPLGKLIGIYNFSCKINNPRKSLTTAVRYAGAWNRDWKPGPYPVTQEERDAAAIKYGLHPKDYEPYPDDGMGYGDYPKLEVVSAESRDPHEHYDFPEHRRNFGEPIHVDYDMYTMERVDASRKFKIPLMAQVVMYIGVMSSFFAFYLFCEKYVKWVTPVMAPYTQIPKEGQTTKHYAFEKPL